MKKIKKIAIVAILITIATSSKAQYDALFTQYMFNEMFINPAYAGSKEAMSATLLHRQQWVNFPGRPVTTSFSLHGPLMQNKMGLGLSVLNETIGVLNRNLVYASYAYRMKTGDKGHLAFGLMGGIHNQINKFASLKTNDDGTVDPQLGQNSPSIIAPNFGSGIYFNTKTFYTGLSIPRMVDDRVTFNPNGDVLQTTKIDPSKFHYYFTIGNMFTLSSDLKLKGQAMVKAVQNAPIQYDLTATFFIKEMIWAGVSYRSNSAVAAIIGVQINPQFLVSYSYDYGINMIQKYSQGSHEIGLNYLFSYKGKKVVTPRYF
ncbi:MAG: type IX secretion system membrane protein PorP/SprF [Bacteroidota bacterium]|nr:type IX secretion system membrane protein PorP/SprF [Bacteroidota bacterium]MDP3143817.1 type IX secretion system membrane protein PorP/SprF [Bacteroidota bacterium]MDP3556936.1 type IX secretion system membrane protein PorP/SprF [Bacteroidota bacterium]